MKIKYYGTAASEGWPALYCKCDGCERARKLGGKSVRSRFQVLIDDTVLIDYPADTYYHTLKGLDLIKVKTLLISHSHGDHFQPSELESRIPWFIRGERIPYLMNIYGNEVVRDRVQEKVMDCFDCSVVVFGNHLIEPFEEIDTEDGYHVKAYKANHMPSEKAMFYSVEKDGKRVLVAHDTGYFPEETREALKGLRFDFISLDCTGLDNDWRDGHMGFTTVYEVKERLLQMGCADEKTIFAASHYAHFPNFDHNVIEAEVTKHGVLATYDGLEIEF